MNGGTNYDSPGQHWVPKLMKIILKKYLLFSIKFKRLINKCVHYVKSIYIKFYLSVCLVESNKRPNRLDPTFVRQTIWPHPLLVTISWHTLHTLNSYNCNVKKRFRFTLSITKTMQMENHFLPAGWKIMFISGSN